MPERHRNWYILFGLGPLAGLPTMPRPRRPGHPRCPARACAQCTRARCARTRAPRRAPHRQLTRVRLSVGLVVAAGILGPGAPGTRCPACALAQRTRARCALRAHRTAPPADAGVSFRFESSESTEIQVASHQILGRAWECAAGGVALLEVHPLSPFQRCDSGRPALLTLTCTCGSAYVWRPQRGARSGPRLC